MTREIHKRINHGITVTLFAVLDDDSKECREVFCNVKSENEDFTIRDIPKDKALDVFYHPYSSGIALLETGKLPC